MHVSRSSPRFRREQDGTFKAQKRYDDSYDPSKRVYPPISRESIVKYFRYPITKAAQALDVCDTRLKLTCRSYGLRRWPYRTISSADKRVQTLRTCIDSMLEYGSRYVHVCNLLHEAEREAEAIYNAFVDELYGTSIPLNTQDPVTSNCCAASTQPSVVCISFTPFKVEKMSPHLCPLPACGCSKLQILAQVASIIDKA